MVVLGTILSSTGTAAAQGELTVFTGLVTVFGSPAPSGTVVQFSLEDGTFLGETTTGKSGAASDRYTFAILSNPDYVDQMVLPNLPGVPYTKAGQPVFEAHAVIEIDISGLSTPPPPSNVALVNVPGVAVLSLNGSGIDNYGNEVISTAGPIPAFSLGQRIELPIPVALGATLEEFSDGNGGVTIQRVDGLARVRIAVRDEEGNDTIRVLAFTENLTGNGTGVGGVVVKMGIDLPTKSVDLSAEDADVGTASVKVIADITSFPSKASMTMSVFKDWDADAIARISQKALAAGFEIDDLGFGVDFDKQNLDEVLGPVTLTLSLGEAWVDTYGAANIQVFRNADDGTTQILALNQGQTKDGVVPFTLVSPDGLSGFGIAALKKAQDPTPTPEPTPTSAPTSTPVAVSQPTAVPEPTSAVVVTSSPNPTPVPTIQSVGENQGEEPSGGGCSAPPRGGGKVDLSLLAILMGMVGMMVVRRASS